MAKVDVSSVSVMDVAGDSHDHNEEVARIINDHLTQGYTLTQMIYCQAAGH